MILKGQFKTIDNQKTYEVTIGKSGETKMIEDIIEGNGTSGEIVCFSNDPVEINSDLSDTFQNVFIRNATINLTANFDLMEHLLAENYVDIPVKIEESGSQEQWQEITGLTKHTYVPSVVVGNEGLWGTSSANRHVYFEVNAGEVYKIRRKAAGWNRAGNPNSSAFSYCFLSEYGAVKAGAPITTFVEGTTTNLPIMTKNGDEVEFTIPAGCHYLLLAYSKTATGAAIISIFKRIFVANDYIFNGYVEPLSFNMPFAHVFDELSLNCVDKLGTLQYVKFADLIDLNNLEYMTPRSIIELCLNTCEFSAIEFNISSYDFTNTTKVNPSIFIGESPDDWMNCDEVINELGKIYGFWVWQDGDICKVENIMNYEESPNISVQKEDYASDDMNITAEQAYSEIKLTCDIEAGETTLVDIFNKDYLKPIYNKSKVYMQEIIFAGWGETAYRNFANYITGWTTQYDGQRVHNHYCRALKNDMFDFGENGYINNITNDVDLMYWLNEHAGKGAFVSLGKTENIMNTKDNKTISSVSMKDYLVISIQGQQRELSDQTMETQIQNNSPVCSCTVQNVQNLTPNDVNTRNYIVISGNIILNPIQPKTGSIPTLKTVWNANLDTGFLGIYQQTLNTITSLKDDYEHISPFSRSVWHHTVPVPENGDGAYYQHKFANRTTPESTLNNEPIWDESGVGTYGDLGNDKNKAFQYKSNIDEISKLPILCCQLKVGNMYCVERLDLGDDGVNVFQWWPEDNLPQITDPVSGEKVDLNYFTIGINPAIDQYIIGNSNQIADTTTIGMNIEEKGTAIPITWFDKLSGKLEFKILGPFNLTFEHGKFGGNLSNFWEAIFAGEGTKKVLEQLENILISDFKIKLCSDNAKTELNNDNDLVYHSASNPIYNEAQEYDVKFCSGLTTEEANNLGVDFSLNNSVILKLDDTPFYGFDYVEDEETIQAKLEELRVSEQYKIWGKSKKVLDFTLKCDAPYFANYKYNFTFPYFAGESFHCIGRDLNLKQNTMTIKAKQI